MDSPLRSPSPARDDFDDFGAPPTLPLPSGTYTLLPLVEKCDNVELPVGPWGAADCRRRWEQHCADEKARKLNSGAVFAGNNGGNGAGGESSALADEDDDEEEVDENSPAQFEHEFLTPFFLSMPPSSPSSAPGTPVRRGSNASSSRPSFSRLTPLPSLRPSSPTSSAASHAATSRPIPPDASQPVGFLRPKIVRALIEDNRKLVQMNVRPVWRFDPPISFPPPTRRPSYGSSRPGSRRGSRTVLNALSSTTGSVSNTAPGTPGETPAAATNGNGSDAAAFKDVLEGLRNLAAGGEGAGMGVYAVSFEEWVNEEGPAARREHMDRLVRGWKMGGQFLECLGGWRDEEYTIYGPPPVLGEGDNPLPGSNEAFRMERSACALFGLATFGVHCTAYVEEEGKPLRLWIPRRSPTKQTCAAFPLLSPSCSDDLPQLAIPAVFPTPPPLLAPPLPFPASGSWPSMLDNTVAGGITAGDTPRHSIIRECAEEASLPPSFVAPRIQAAGVLVYNYRTAEGYIQPEVQYVYDLKLPPPEQGEGAVKPTTNPEDGEVESFELLELEEVVKRMVDGEFKPNCALVLIDFFLRRGLLTFESDARFLEIATRLRRRLVLPGPA
ncbi:hypothetical protein JCM6882_006623 [Rhodosporidiobolus microsporus]